MDVRIKDIIKFIKKMDPDSDLFNCEVYDHVILTIELLKGNHGLDSYNITKKDNKMTIFGHYNLPDDDVLVNTDKNPRVDITGMCPQQIFNIMMKMYEDDHRVAY